MSLQPKFKSISVKGTTGQFLLWGNRDANIKVIITFGTSRKVTFTLRIEWAHTSAVSLSMFVLCFIWERTLNLFSGRNSLNAPPHETRINSILHVALAVAVNILETIFIVIIFLQFLLVLFQYKTKDGSRCNSKCILLYCKCIRTLFFLI